MLHQYEVNHVHTRSKITNQSHRTFLKSKCLKALIINYSISVVDPELEVIGCPDFFEL